MPNTITGDDGASAISTMLAVDEDWGGARLDNQEHLRNLFVCRSANSRHWHVGISDAHGSRFCFLREPNIVGHAQIDYGPDAQPGKRLNAIAIWLGTPIETIVNPGEIGNPRHS